MSASWDGFRALLQEESKILGDLNTHALAMTEALVQKDFDKINEGGRSARNDDAGLHDHRQQRRGRYAAAAVGSGGHRYPRSARRRRDQRCPAKRKQEQGRESMVNARAVSAIRTVDFPRFGTCTFNESDIFVVL